MKPTHGQANNTSILCRTIPTPASAGPPPPVSAGPPPAQAIPIVLRARVRVIALGKSNIYYVARQPDGAGFMILTETLADSLQVEYDPTSSERQTLRIPDVSLTQTRKE